MEYVELIEFDDTEVTVSSVSRSVFDPSSFSLPIAVTSDGGPVLPSILPQQLPTPPEPCRQLRTRSFFQLTSPRRVQLYTCTRTCTCAPGVLAVRDALVRVARPQCRPRSDHGAFGNAHATRNDLGKYKREEKELNKETTRSVDSSR